MCPASLEHSPPPPILPATVFNELCSYLRESGSTLSASDALSTALTLVAHANDQAQNTLERRLPKYRRAWDQLEDVD
jgi:hypothetical protein